jgi:RNA polymerase sigma-70 factor, ECF subfamily
MESDLLLLNAAKQMNQDALVKIFELYASALYNYALRLCGDALLADHIVGDVFAKLLDQFASGKGPTSNLRSYLYETAYHILIDEARSSSRRAPLEVATSIRSDAGSGSLGVEDKLMLEMILGAIQNNLNDDQRHVITLRFLEGFSLRETAAILGRDVSHVKVIQTRGLAKLRNVFASNEIRTSASLPRIAGNYPMP